MAARQGPGGGFGARGDGQGRGDRQGRGQAQGSQAPGQSGQTRTSDPPPALPNAAETIDALFGPVQFTETRSRAWMMTPDKKLKSVALRLGITDGNFTEVIGEPEGLGPDTVVVTAINLPTSASAQAGRSPLMPGGPGRGGPGGGGRPGGGR
jgi:hypothetical protein